MVQCIQAIVTEPGSLSLVPWTHLVEGENDFGKLSSDLYIKAMAYALPTNQLNERKIKKNSIHQSLGTSLFCKAYSRPRKMA